MCPFCGGVARRPASKTKSRGSRSAMIGAAAVVVSCATSGVVACGGVNEPGDDGGTDAANHDEGIVAAYGGPFDAAQVDSSPHDANVPDSIVAAYGGPIEAGNTD
jgi:hypothetical protein